MKKFSAILLAFVLCFGVIGGGVAFAESNEYTTLTTDQEDHLNNVGAPSGILPSRGVHLGTALRQLLVPVSYTRLPYFSRLTMPGSGAPVGAQILRGGSNNDCGTSGDGTTVYVCTSDGTNWKAL